ncbi:MAG: hypothetical protein SF172_04435 [Burkholderiales bacterium]|nr:hypothetical protein [Betaproteobacteria bacterium]MDX2218249.1 hypothetical protein [Burkholderiales bacterium]
MTGTRRDMSSLAQKEDPPIGPIGDPSAESVLVPVSIVKTPGNCTPEEREAFRRLLLKGGEVIPRGLASRIERAHQLSFVYMGTSLAATGAVKAPDPDYRADAFHDAATKADPKTYPVELGWVYVDDAYRGRKLSRSVVNALLPFFGTHSCYATSKVPRIWMHSTLKRFGFAQSGKPFASKLANENLLLFLREGQTDGEK